MAGNKQTLQQLREVKTKLLRAEQEIIGLKSLNIGTKLEALERAVGGLQMRTHASADGLADRRIAELTQAKTQLENQAGLALQNSARYLAELIAAREMLVTMQDRVKTLTAELAKATGKKAWRALIVQPGEAGTPGRKPPKRMTKGRQKKISRRKPK